MMALYAFAGSRLIPALQQVYQALAKLRYGKPALDELHQDMTEIGLIGPPGEKVTHEPENLDIRLRSRLELKNVSYRYPEAEVSALRGLNLAIEANMTVALVGGSGAGKTTAIDIILGLLTPEEGEVLIDGVPLDVQNVRSWQKNVGYVPQSIFLIDDTLEANIAFGGRGGTWIAMQ